MRVPRCEERTCHVYSIRASHLKREGEREGDKVAPSILSGSTLLGTIHENLPPERRLALCLERMNVAEVPGNGCHYHAVNLSQSTVTSLARGRRGHLPQDIDQ